MQIETLFRKHIISYVFYSKLATFTDFERKISTIHRFFKKNFVRFEKSYGFCRILEQLCHKLFVKQIHGQNRRTSDSSTLDIRENEKKRSL